MIKEARSITDRLFEIVRSNALYNRPISERHRIIFYIGHLEAFDWNLIGSQGAGAASAHAEFDRLFAFGIDPVGGGLPTDQPSDWPRLPEVQGYVGSVRREIEKLLGDGRSAPNGWKYSRELLLQVAIEHRLMHAETLAYMFHRLPYDQKVAPAGYQAADAAYSGVLANHRMIDIPAGSATLGIPRGSGTFGWDNEFEAHEVQVPAFAMDEYKVTNGDYLKFIVTGAYEDPSHWSAADWIWIKEQNVRHPAFWRQTQGRWNYLGMFEEIPLPLDWPVYVSHAEASAYARFAGKALPTEAQYHRAAYGTPQHGERQFPWGDAPPDTTRGNFDFERWDPASVTAHPEGRSAFGVEDMLGNGWEWTSTLFEPFEGFEAFPFYQGYSANFFDGKHFVMKGGSPRTAACMLRRSFRNWFQAHYPFVYASFRCCK